MLKNTFIAYWPTLLLAYFCIIMPKAYFTQEFNLCASMLYHFTHANVFHLLANFSVLCMFRPKPLNALVGWFIATISTSVVQLSIGVPTCGISAIIFAMLARRDAFYGTCNLTILLINSVFIFLPLQVNGKIHLACYLSAYGIWSLIFAIKRQGVYHNTIRYEQRSECHHR